MHINKAKQLGKKSYQLLGDWRSLLAHAGYDILFGVDGFDDVGLREQLQASPFHQQELTEKVHPEIRLLLHHEDQGKI